MKILYAADRASVMDTLLGRRYSDGRADHLTFGMATVSIDPAVSWEQLVRDSTSRQREQKYWMQMKSTVEYGQLVIALNKMEVRDGRYRLSADSGGA